MAFLFQRGRQFHGGYYDHGVERHVSLKTDNRKTAEKRLNVLVRKSARGWNPEDEKLSFDGLIEKVRLDRAVRGRRCNDLDQRAVHLRLFFCDVRAVDITTESVQQYVTSRMKGDAAPATINRELALLRRAFKLSELTRQPRIQLLPENNARQDFLDWADFQAVRSELPEWARDVITFMYLSSWRSGQVVAMEWRDIDMRERTATARGETTKSGEPHRIALVGELWEIIERADLSRRSVYAHRPGLDGPRALLPFVFHHNGNPFLLRGGKVAAARSLGTRPRAAAGWSHVMHCLRRSGIRNMIGAGLDPMKAMKISGHKSFSMLARYNIIDIDDIKQGLEQTMRYSRGAALGQ